MIQIDTRFAIAVGLGLILFWGSSLLLNAFRQGLRQIPGPWLAKFSPLWRLRFVWNGTAHEGYQKLHEQYGQIVRTAPNVVDISDPDALPTIYGINSKFRKSPFYVTFATLYEDQFMESMFSTRDSEEHKHLKRPVAQKYSMTSIRTMEYLVDPCSKIFIDAMTDLQGQIIDLGAWLQWYAFDVIGAITFSQRYGFMEKRKDVHNVIAGIETGLMYGSLVGQIPWLHTFLLGNLTSRKILAKLTGGAGDPIPIVTQMVLDSIKQYDAEAADKTTRGDFLAYLRQQEKSTGKMSHRDLLNHLTNNLLAGSDTTGISLRAVFYYLMQNKQAYETLQKEIDQADAAGKLSPIATYAESLQLEYLQACLKEAMRMHPGVSYPLERIVPPGGAKLCDIHIPAGTIVGVNAAVIHRNTDIFGADANQFRPERWLDKEDEARIKTMDRHIMTMWSYICAAQKISSNPRNYQFGAGVRTCIGKNISIMEMGKLVPQVLRQFDLEWASSEPHWRVQTYWFAKQTGLLVRMRPRHVLSTDFGAS